jgi:hypothetical protein
MKVGDLVKLPPTVIGNHAKGAVVGVVLKQKAHAVTVSTPRGNEMWWRKDIRLLARNR